MKPSLPIVRLSRDDVSLAFEQWFCTRYDIGFPAVIEHRFHPDGSATLLVVGLGVETPVRKNFGTHQVGESLQLWLDYERRGAALELVEFLPESDGSAVAIVIARP